MEQGTRRWPRMATIGTFTVLAILISVVAIREDHEPRRREFGVAMPDAADDAAPVGSRTTSATESAEPVRRAALPAEFLSLVILDPLGGPVEPRSEVWGWKGCPLGRAPRLLATTAADGVAELGYLSGDRTVHLAGIVTASGLLHPVNPVVAGDLAAVPSIRTTDATPSILLYDASCRPVASIECRAGPARSTASATGTRAPALEATSVDPAGTWVSDQVLRLPRDLFETEPPARVVLVQPSGHVPKTVEVDVDRPWLIPVALEPAGGIRLTRCRDCADAAGVSSGRSLHITGRSNESDSESWTLSTPYSDLVQLIGVPPGEYHLDLVQTGPPAAHDARPVVLSAAPVEGAVRAGEVTEFGVCFCDASTDSSWGAIEILLRASPGELPTEALVVDPDTGLVKGLMVAVRGLVHDSLPGVAATHSSRVTTLLYDGAVTFSGSIDGLLAGPYLVSSQALELFGRLDVPGGSTASIEGTLGRSRERRVFLLGAPDGAALEGLAGFGQHFPDAERIQELARGVVRPVPAEGLTVELVDGPVQAYVAADGYLTALVDLDLEAGDRELVVELTPQPSADLWLDGSLAPDPILAKALSARFVTGEWDGLENPLKVLSTRARDGRTEFSVRATFEGEVVFRLEGKDREWRSPPVRLHGGDAIDVELRASDL